MKLGAPSNISGENCKKDFINWKIGYILKPFQKAMRGFCLNEGKLKLKLKKTLQGIFPIQIEFKYQKFSLPNGIHWPP